MIKDIKKLLDIKGCNFDALLNHYLQDTIQAILDYCHIKKLPDALKTMVFQIVIERYNNLTSENISSVKRGDTQVSYFDQGTINFTDDQIKRLNNYRKIKTR